MTIYAIGDIHGQLDMLLTALALVDGDGGPDAEIVFLGDLVDRGPDSRGVIEHLMQGQAEGRRWHVLKGNHDRLFEGFVSRGFQYDPMIKSGLGWLHPRMGGVATLMIIFPISKLMHAPGLFFSPSRNQIDNPREKRHLAPWAAELEK